MRHNPIAALTLTAAMLIPGSSAADDPPSANIPNIPPAYKPLFEEGRAWTFEIKEEVKREAGLPTVRRTFHQICLVAQTWNTPELRASRIACVTDGTPWRDDMLFPEVVIATSEGLYLGNPHNPLRGDAAPKTLAEVKAIAAELGGLIAPIPPKAHNAMSPRGGSAAWPARVKLPGGGRVAGWCAKIQDNNDGLMLQWCLAPGMGPVSGVFAITSIDVTDPANDSPGIGSYQYTARLLGTHPPR